MNYNLRCKKYIAVFFIFIIVFFIGEEIDPNEQEKITSKAVNQIEREETVYKVEDLINSAPGDYYRLIFHIESDEDSTITVKISALFEGEKILEDIEVKSGKRVHKELIFDTPGRYTTLSFEKKDKNNTARILIGNIKISRLNPNDVIFDKLKPSLLGNTVMKVDQESTGKMEAHFNNLNDSNILVGQVFKAQSSYLAGLRVHIIKIGNGGAGKYRLELRPVKVKNGEYIIGKNMLTYSEFKAEYIDNYKDKETGKILLPIAYNVQPGEYYYIGISNDNVKTNFFNYLRIIGTTRFDAYNEGGAIITSGKNIEKIGNLDFQVVAAEYSYYKGERLLKDSIIEDLGSGQGSYYYKTKNDIFDFLDVEEYSVAKDAGIPGIRFNEHEKTVSGNPANDNYYIYKVNTIYPFTKMIFDATQKYPFWYNLKIYYSYDKERWMEIDIVEDNLYGAPQVFRRTIDTSIDNVTKPREVYFKITYDHFDKKEIKLFGLEEMRIKALLSIE